MNSEQFFNCKNFYLVGLKGVAMTSIAQCLIDADKKVYGCDVKEKFVTQQLLSKLKIPFRTGFDHPIPKEVECVIYTAAHQGIDNPFVRKAVENNIPVISQAEALSYFFNQKKGLAVSGVGGKSTVSAMLTWIFTKLKLDPSFSVGVGNIPILNKTGAWLKNSEYFIAEADEYVIDPKAALKKEPIKPRFSFLKPYLTICTNLKYDHPDVYKNFEHTQQIFLDFFNQTKKYLVVNADNKILIQLAQNTNKNIISFGESAKADFRLVKCQSQSGQTKAEFIFQKQTYQLNLTIPGKFNILNALSAIAACSILKLNLQGCIDALKNFPSTKRRFEFIGEIKAIKYYDDYAHHPSEVAATIRALNDWYPDSKKIVAFQPHTFSRTKQLFTEFVNAFSEAEEVVLLDIFPSAREFFDKTISSSKLVKAIKQKYPKIKIQNVHTIPRLKKYFNRLKKKTVVITLGAGDIYEVYEGLKKK